MIFNSKLIKLEMLKTDQKKAEEGFSIIQSYAKPIMNAYEEIGDIVFDEKKIFYSNYLSLAPKKNGAFLLGKSVRESIKHMMDQTKTNKILRKFIGLWRHEEYRLQNLNLTKSNWREQGFLYPGVGIVSDETGMGIEPLDKLNKELKNYRFIFCSSISSAEHKIDPDFRDEYSAVVFGAINPYHYYLFSFLKAKIN